TVRLATAPTPVAHRAGRCAIPLTSSALRRRKHLRCPGTRARTTGTLPVGDAARGHQTRCHMARPKGLSPTSQPLPDAGGRLYISPPLPSPARSLVLPRGESPWSLSLADRSDEPHLPLTLQRAFRRGTFPNAGASQPSAH